MNPPLIEVIEKVLDRYDDLIARHNADVLS